MTNDGSDNSNLVERDEGQQIIDFFERMDWSDLVFHTIFELEKKYARSLKQKIIVKVDEAEVDRSKSSNAYMFLAELNESLTDASLYENYIDMYDLRELFSLEEFLSPHKRLDYFALQVAKKCQPVISVVGKSYSSISGEELSLIQTADDIEPQYDESYNFWNKSDFSSLSSFILTYGDIMNIESDLINKLMNKTFKKIELEAILSPIEGEILSKMIAEKKIKAILEKEEVTFEKPGERIEEKEVPSSLLLSPRNEENR